MMTKSECMQVHSTIRWSDDDRDTGDGDYGSEVDDGEDDEEDEEEDDDDDEEEEDGEGRMHASALSSGAWDTVLVFRVALNRRLQCLLLFRGFAIFSDFYFLSWWIVVYQK